MATSGHGADPREDLRRRRCQNGYERPWSNTGSEQILGGICVGVAAKMATIGHGARRVRNRSSGGFASASMPKWLRAAMEEDGFGADPREDLRRRRCQNGYDWPWSKTSSEQILGGFASVSMPKWLRSAM